MKKKLGLAVATLAVATTLSGCFTDAGQSNDEALRVALQFNPVADFSPYSDDAVLNLRMGAVETLVTLDENGKLNPVLAEKWEMKDDHTAVLTLRKDVTFHDGSKLTGEVVKNALDHALSAATRPKGLGKDDLKVEATGESEVTITASEADPILVQRFTDPGAAILSKDAYAGENPDPFNHGTGPFKLVKKESDGSVSAEAFADYWNGTPETSALKVSFIEDGAARANAFRAGDFDVIKGVPVVALPELSDAQVTDVHLPRAVLLHLNAEKGVFADAKLRTAVAGAIKTDAIVDKIYEGKANKAEGSLFNLDAQWAQKAKPLAGAPADAGIGKGKTVRLATWDSRAELPETANLIADQLRALGFNVDITIADYASLENRLLDGSFDAVIGSRSYMIGAGDPVAFLDTDFTCEGSYNLSRLCDPEIDKKIAAAKSEKNLDIRLKDAATIGADVVATGSVVPLAHEQLLVVSKDVEGLAVDPMERSLITEKTKKTAKK
ncbi:ABC transporter substrate-binding protein [Corynebacterium rouxii]|uniref:ABC transporter substrate-binding protein n=1 Tax=Corynebacterium rouxii TaxID=2719119 RepID=A0ABU3PK39_9CORY|nr:ABC transporter substrate-binding protein [Corynebacterium rouxii]MDT9408024.1 ABC transporter substrate-binding protein [Corynebacterium rouxii]MDT9410206.1 ABC transporter substrate-binding protein [Corynebacterium rouxii]